MLEDNREAITRKVGRPVEVVGIGVRDLARTRTAPRNLFTDDLAGLVSRGDVDVVLELIGGLDPAGSLVEQALERGVPVVTANKELIAKQGRELLSLAGLHHVDLHFEAAVGGGIPLVQPLKHQLAGNDVLKLIGILNGTTNTILTRMAADGTGFDEALREAQELGYAEADPTNDIDGYDAAYKLAILGSIAFGRQVPVDQVYREGIRRVSQVDMHFADVLGYAIKLLAIIEPVRETLLARVHPTLIPRTHPLAGVDGVYNAVWLHGDFVGDLMFSGRGAGSDPTASAVVGDLIGVARDVVAGQSGQPILWGEPIDLLPIDDLETSYYVRLNVQDRPKVLGQIALEFGHHDVGLSAMEMRVIDRKRELGEIVFLTHRCRESDFRAGLASVAALDAIVEVCSDFRVEA
jgi:homoserine dehydrogenase